MHWKEVERHVGRHYLHVYSRHRYQEEEREERIVNLRMLLTGPAGRENNKLGRRE
jgi:hypothetical protein